LQSDVDAELVCTAQHTLACFMLDVQHPRGRGLLEAERVWTRARGCEPALLHKDAVDAERLLVPLPRKHQQEVSRMLRYYQAPEKQFLSYGRAVCLSKNAVRSLRVLTDSAVSWLKGWIRRCCFAQTARWAATIVEDTTWRHCFRVLPPKAVLFNVREVFFSPRHIHMRGHARGPGAVRGQSLKYTMRMATSKGGGEMHKHAIHMQPPCRAVISTPHEQPHHRQHVQRAEQQHGNTRGQLSRLWKATTFFHDSQSFTVQNIQAWAIIAVRMLCRSASND
jgi:hypothetical protein